MSLDPSSRGNHRRRSAPNSGRRVHQLRVNQHRYRSRKREEIMVLPWPITADDLIDLVLHPAGIRVTDRSKENLSQCLDTFRKLLDDGLLSITRRENDLG